MTNDQIRLHFGELNDSEMRLARAIVGWHEAEQAKLRAAADGLAEALAELVQCNESHNETISRIMGAPIRWKDVYLDRSRLALAAYQTTKP